jgi:hypothetical protein
MRERRAAAFAPLLGAVAAGAADGGFGTFDARAGVTMGSAKGAFLRIAKRGGPKRGESYPGSAAWNGVDVEGAVKTSRLGAGATGADVEDGGEEDAGSKASWRIGVPSAAQSN